MRAARRDKEERGKRRGGKEGGKEVMRSLDADCLPRRQVSAMDSLRTLEDKHTRSLEYYATSC